MRSPLAGVPTLGARSCRPWSLMDRVPDCCRARRAAGMVIAALALPALLAAGGCGSTGDDGSREPGTEPKSPMTAVDDVAVTVEVHYRDDRARLAYVVTNERDEPIALVDPADAGNDDRPDGKGGFVVTRDRTEADASSGDKPLGRLYGITLTAGETIEGELAIEGRFETPPTGFKLCVEVIDAFRPTGPGKASFPYRQPSEPAKLACSPRVEVDR